jgi:hypothetical protein
MDVVGEVVDIAKGRSKGVEEDYRLKRREILARYELAIQTRPVPDQHQTSTGYCIWTTTDSERSIVFGDARISFPI